MWRRFQRWISGSSEPLENDRARPLGEAPSVLLTLRNLEVARRFPQDLPDDVVGLKTGESHACTRCAGALKRVIITTGGPYGDQTVWEAYPLALDGWRCEKCQNVTYPAFLSPDEITALLDESVAFARSGALDDAEFGFRRVVSSWPTYMPARVNFGSMCLDRIRAEQQGNSRTEIVDRYAQMAEAQFRKSLSCEPAAPLQVQFMLGKLLYRRNKRDEGIALLNQIMQSTDVPSALREEARSLLAEAK